MREIKLNIQKNEDLVLLMQGLNWVRLNCLQQTKNELELEDKTKGKIKCNLLEHSNANDRLLSLIVQLDKLLEGVKEK